MTAAPSSHPAAPLRVQRQPLAQILASAGHDHAHAPFAALTYGVAGHEPWMTGVAAHVLLEHEPLADVWHAGAAVQSGTTGVVRWRTDGDWLLGVVDLSEADEAGGLEPLARRAYGNVFDAMRQTLIIAQ